MLQEGLVRSFDIIAECKEKKVDVLKTLKMETFAPSVEVSYIDIGYKRNMQQEYRI